MNRSRIGIFAVEILLASSVLSPAILIAQKPSDVEKEREEQTGSTEAYGEWALSLSNLGAWDTASGIPRLGFGVGPFYSFDSQSSLSNSFSRTTSTVRDLNRGTVSTTVFDGDPELNNRKFDYGLDFAQAGVRVPIALPRLAGARIFSVDFGIEAGFADVDFDIRDLAQPALSTSFSGDGASYGIGFDVAACATAGCKWITSVGYWYRYLPSLDLDRSQPPFLTSPVASNLRRDDGFAVVTEASAGIELLADEATLSREAHELSFRFGYNLETEKRRWAPYTGAIFRRTEVEVEDVLTFSALELGLETTLTSTSRFDSDTVLGVVGVEGRLSESLSGRLESFFGDGDHGVRFQIGWNWWGKDDDPELAKERERRKLEKREKQAQRRFEKWEKRFASMAPGLLARLLEIEKEYLEGWKSLETVEGTDAPSYPIDDIKALLASTQDDLVDALSNRRASRHRALTPLRDYVIYRYGRTLELLESTTETDISTQATMWRNVVPAVFKGPKQSFVVPAQDPGTDQTEHPVLRFFYRVFPFLKSAIEDEDCRYVEIKFVREAATLKTVLAVGPYSSGGSLPAERDRVDFEDPRKPWPVPRGIHGYFLFENSDDLLDRGNHLLVCPPGRKTCPLDLVERPCSELRCSGDRCSQGGNLPADRCVAGRPPCN